MSTMIKVQFSAVWFLVLSALSASAVTAFVFDIRRDDGAPTCRLGRGASMPNNENSHQQSSTTRQSLQLSFSTTRIRSTAARPPTTQLWLGKRMKYQAPTRVSAATEYIRLESADEAWKMMDIVQMLQEQGAVGVVPTDGGYALVTPLNDERGNHNKRGLERLELIWNNFEQEQENQRRGEDESSSKKNKKKDGARVSLACSDLKTIGEYCYNIDKNAFKLLKNNLPGPFTFILPGSRTLLPKSILEHANNNKQLLTIPVQTPQDPILRYLQDDLLGGIPLLLADLNFQSEDDNDNDAVDNNRANAIVHQCYVDQEDAWCHQVDFLVDAGGRQQIPSTLYDLTRTTAGGDPLLISQHYMGELLSL